MLETRQRRHRVVGAVVGWVVGDALGAPFEFGPPGAFGTRFPKPALGERTEMCGGQGWAPGEWTDDTQMGLHIAASLLDRGSVDEADVFARFRAWVAAEPNDVGVQTRAVLTLGLPWDQAAQAYVASGRPAAGNGSLMRILPAAVYFARDGRASADAAKRISDLTHGDPAAAAGCQIFHELVRAALDGADPIDLLPAAVGNIDPSPRERWNVLLDPSWTPALATERNGAVWPTLATAVWALRTTTTYADALRAAIDCGGDTDTVGCVTGALAGAVYGIGAIPSRWTTYLHGPVPGDPHPVAADLTGLQDLAIRLDGGTPRPMSPPDPCLGPTEVAPGLWVGSLDGAVIADPSYAVISLCRTEGRITAPLRRNVFITDTDGSADNPAVQAVLADVLDEIDAFHAQGHQALIHCHGGASRTGLILRAWLMRHDGLSATEATAEARRRWPACSTWNHTFDAALRDLAGVTR